MSESQWISQQRSSLPCDCIEETSFFKNVEHALPLPISDLLVSLLPLLFSVLDFGLVDSCDGSFLCPRGRVDGLPCETEMPLT